MLCIVIACDSERHVWILLLSFFAQEEWKIFMYFNREKSRVWDVF